MLKAGFAALATLLTIVVLIVVLIAALTTTLIAAVIPIPSWLPLPTPDASSSATPGRPTPTQPAPDGGNQTPSTTPNCAPRGSSTGPVAGFKPDQIANTATIIAVGKRMGIPERGQVVAISAGIQESGLRNLNHGDRDSLGVFQQRPSQGWGTPAQVMDPTYAATQFYQHLRAIPRWEQLTVNDAAQAVQRSATPTAYARHEPAARALVTALATSTCTTPRPTNPPQATTNTAAKAVAFARQQLGVPYRWGGNGPDAFDCSGLTRAAYAAAGIQIPRKAQWQFDAGPRIPAVQPPQPGDLVFFGTGPNHIVHVGIAISATQMINAPYAGAAVRINGIPPNRVGITRPSAPSSGG